MRRDEAVLGRPERVPVRQRLRVRDVQTRRADAALVQRLHQRGVVDQAAARDVDDDRRRLEVEDARRRHEVFRDRRQGAREHEDVDLLHERLQPGGRGGGVAAGGGGGAVPRSRDMPVWIPRAVDDEPVALGPLARRCRDDDVHAKGVREPRRLAANAAVPDDAHRLAAQFRGAGELARGHVRGAVPALLLRVRQEKGQARVRAQRLQQDVLCDLGAVDARRAAHFDAVVVVARRVEDLLEEGGLDQVLEPGGHALDEFEVRSLLSALGQDEHGLQDLCLGPDGGGDGGGFMVPELTGVFGVGDVVAGVILHVCEMGHALDIL